MTKVSPVVHPQTVKTVTDKKKDIRIKESFSSVLCRALIREGVKVKDIRKEKDMPDNYVEFNIYFSDLNEDAQKRLMERIGITDPKEMNWDIDMAPIAIYATQKE